MPGLANDRLGGFYTYRDLDQATPHMYAELREKIRRYKNFLAHHNTADLVKKIKCQQISYRLQFMERAYWYLWDKFKKWKLFFCYKQACQGIIHMDFLARIAKSFLIIPRTALKPFYYTG